MISVMLNFDKREHWLNNCMQKFGWQSVGLTTPLVIASLRAQHTHASLIIFNPQQHKRNNNQMYEQQGEQQHSQQPQQNEARTIKSYSTRRKPPSHNNTTTTSSSSKMKYRSMSICTPGTLRGKSRITRRSSNESSTSGTSRRRPRQSLSWNRGYSMSTSTPGTRRGRRY